MDNGARRRFIGSRSVRWVAIGIVLGLATLNFYFVSLSVRNAWSSDWAADWWTFTEAGRRATSGLAILNLDEYGYRHSPVMAWFWAAITPLGSIGWRILHVAAAATLPDRRMAMTALLSWPFWNDVVQGNVLIFVVWLGAWASVGSRSATVAYLLAFLVMPRPLMAPLAMWLLWHGPRTRVPFVALFAIHAAILLATANLLPWASALVQSGDEMSSPLNLGPSRVWGVAWFPAAAVLAAWSARKGRIGLASLAASPYWFPHYLLVLLLDGLRPSLHSGLATRKRDRA